MKREIRSICILAAALMAAASCQKGEFKTTERTSEEKIVDFNDTRLVSATLTKSEDVHQAYEQAFAEVAAGPGRLLADNTEQIETLKSVDLGLWEALGMKIETYRITYRTQGGQGLPGPDGSVKYGPAVLSGDVAFIRDTTGRFKRRIESVTLFHTQFNSNEELTIISNPALVPIRTAFNALVVCPHYQGVFVDKGLHVNNMSETMLKARQAIDCELAALEFIQSLNDVEMAEGYYTESMGISNGSAPALATQYLLEKELPKEYAEAINLRGTYCAEGCYDYSQLIYDFISKDFEHPTIKLPFNLDKIDKVADIIDMVLQYADLDYMKPVFFVSLVSSVHAAWKDSFFKGIALEDYFSEKFLKETYDVDGRQLNMLEMFREGCLDPFTQYTELTITEIVNPALLGDEGLNLDAKEVQALKNAFSHTSAPLFDNWHPATPVQFAHSTGDEFCTYEDFLKIVEATGFSGLNRNVSVKTIGSLKHLGATAYFLFSDIILKAHPCPLAGESPKVLPLVPNKN